MKNYLILVLSILASFSLHLALAQPLVHYQDGRIVIDDITLLQSVNESNSYYYLPDAPRLSYGKDSTAAFLLVKYTGQTDDREGGILHMNLNFGLSESKQLDLQKKLQQQRPGATIAGTLPIFSSSDDKNPEAGEVYLGYTDPDKGQREPIATQPIPTSSAAKIAFAAQLSVNGSSLLSEAIKQQHNGLTVIAKGHYLAQMQTELVNIRFDWRKLHAALPVAADQKLIQFMVGRWIQNGLILVSRHVKSNESLMQQVVDLVTQRTISQLMIPEVGAEQQLQFRRRPKLDVTQVIFSMTLTDKKVVRVPYYTASILELDQNSKAQLSTIHFSEEDWGNRKVVVIVDGTYVPLFNDLVNFATIYFRKRGGEGHEISKEVFFSVEDESSNFVKEIAYPTFEFPEGQKKNYEYRVVWHLHNVEEAIEVPSEDGHWISGSDDVVILKPPLDRKDILIDLNKENDTLVKIQVASYLGGQPSMVGHFRFGPGQENGVQELSLFTDQGAKMMYKITWEDKQGKETHQRAQLTTSYLLLTDPKNIKP